MPMPAYLTLEGTKQGKVEGSVTQKGREGTILVQGLAHEVRIPRDRQNGSATSSRVHEPMTVTKTVDKASPKLYQMLTTGEELKSVEVKWYRIDPAGREEHYFTTKLEGAVIVSVKPSLPNCLDPQFENLSHMEDVSFTYRKAIWTWVPDGIEAEDDWENRS